MREMRIGSLALTSFNEELGRGMDAISRHNSQFHTDKSFKPKIKIWGETDWGPLSLLSNGYKGALFPEVKRTGPEGDHSPPTSAEVKNGGAIHPLPRTSSWRSA
jgi:hypothetical protein